MSVYDAQDDIVYAGENGTLTIHGSFTGQRTISLPRRASVYDVTEDKIIASGTRTFRTFLRSRTTRIFVWGEGEALAAATGLELPPPSTAEPLEQPLMSAPPIVSPPPRSSREVAARVEIIPGLIPGLDPVGELSSDPEAISSDEDEEPGTEKTAEAEAAGEVRRSRWQRRRAASRARRDAERAAQAADGTPDPGNAANPPVDIESLLPGLPPRRISPPSEAFVLGSETDEEA